MTKSKPLPTLIAETLLFRITCSDYEIQLYLFWSLECPITYSCWVSQTTFYPTYRAKTENIKESRTSKRERGIWQRRYWEHLIRDEADFENHVNYIHYNPVKHGYVEQAVKWEYSTIHRYIEKGIIPHDWGSDQDNSIDTTFGER